MLPYPPSTNMYYRSFRGRVCQHKSVIEYKNEVCRIMKSLNLFDEKLTDRLAVTIDIHAPTKRKYDIDNRIKAVFDSLQFSGFIEDDEQIDDLRVRRKEKIKGGVVVVSVDKLIEASHDSN